MYLFLFITLYVFLAHRAHQERQIVSIQPLVTVILYWWPSCVQVGVDMSSTLVVLESCHQACMTYTSAECTVENS
jgi:hypothetical protein